MKKLYICKKYEHCPGASVCTFAKPFSYIKHPFACLEEMEFEETCLACKHSKREFWLNPSYREDRIIMICTNTDSETCQMLVTSKRRACIEFSRGEDI